MTSHSKGICCLILSAFGFAVMGLCVRLTDAYGAPISAFQKSFFRNAFACFIAFAFFIRSPPPRIQGTGRVSHRLMILLLRALMGTLGIFGNFYALGKMDLADAMMLNKLSPFFTVLFSWLLLHEKVSLRQILCLIGAFVGALLVIRPGFGCTALLPALCGLLGGICAGFAYACVRELGLLHVNGTFIVLFFSTFSCLASLPFLIFDYHPMTSAQIAILLGAGVSAACGQFGITAAYRLASPRRIAVFDYTNILFASLLGFLFLDQIPDLLSWCGFALILVMAVFIQKHEATRK